MKLFTFLLEILLLLVMPTPANIKKLFNRLNQFFASGEQPQLNQDQWDQLRAYRDSKRSK